MPLYNLAAIVDRQEGAEQVVSLALAYVNEADARQAAEEVARRMLAFYDVRMGDPTPLLANETRLGTVTTTATVYASETAGRYVALVEMRYPMPDNALRDLVTGEVVDDGGSVQASGMLIRALMNSVYNRSFTPIMVDWGAE